MIKIKGKELPKAIGRYYLSALCHIILLAVIKFTGWNTFTNLLFFAGTFLSIGIAAYILHIYFKDETEDMSDEERELKSDYGQIWIIIAHLVVLLCFIFF